MRPLLLAIPLALAAFLLLAWPTYWIDLILMRELFRAAEALGLIGPGGPFWGQIAGRNIPRHSEAMHLLVRFLAALPAYVPALLVALGLYAVVWRRASHVLRPGGRDASVLARSVRLGVPILLFALILTLAQDRLESRIRNMVFEAGRAAGCNYFMSGGLLVGPDGPFFGGGFEDAFNFAWRTLPWAAAVLGAFAPSLAVFHVLIRRSARPDRWHCVCGYSLAGLRDPRCPECGRPIRPAP